MMRKLFIVVVVLALTGLSILGQAKPSIQGVWRVVESSTTGPTAFTNKTPQPGVIIFTGKHYAIVRDTARETRPPVKDVANTTPAEALASFGPFQAQAGTYEVSGGTVTLRASVAKVPPANGKYENVARWSVKLDGTNLVLTQVSTSRGKIPNPQTIRLASAE
jgi:hypothetical protein